MPCYGKELVIVKNNETVVAVSSWKSALLAFGFMLVNFFLSFAVMASMVHDRVPNQPTLPDLAFDVLPRNQQAMDVADVILAAMASCFLLLLLVHRHRLVILRRFFVIAGLLYFLRTLCMAITSLPMAEKQYHCAPKSDVSPLSGDYLLVVLERVTNILVNIGSLNFHFPFCGDFIFSGHTITYVLMYLFQREYLLPTRIRTVGWHLLHLVFALAAFVGVACLLISRVHYSIDVLLAYILTTSLFHAYHTLCYTPALHQPGASNNHLTRVWWWPVFRIFETPTERLPRSFEWPLPWPRWLRKR